MNANCTRTRMGITDSAANVAASTTPAEVITPPRDRQTAQYAVSGTVFQGFFAHPGHQKDVVVDPQGYKEHKPKQRHSRISTWEIKNAVEDQRSNPHSGAKGNNGGGNQQHRCQN